MIKFLFWVSHLSGKRPPFAPADWVPITTGRHHYGPSRGEVFCQEAKGQTVSLGKKALGAFIRRLELDFYHKTSVALPLSDYEPCTSSLTSVFSPLMVVIILLKREICNEATVTQLLDFSP